MVYLCLCQCARIPCPVSCERLKFFPCASVVPILHYTNTCESGAQCLLRVVPYRRSRYMLPPLHSSRQTSRHGDVVLCSTGDPDIEATGDPNKRFEAKRAALERLVSSDADGVSANDADQVFRVAEQRQAPAGDDLESGLAELKAVGGAVGGNLVLLAEICVGGLRSPAGLLSVALFALLYASGEFGSPAPFVTQAPSEGNYYRLMDPAELLRAESNFCFSCADGGAAEPSVVDEANAAWERLRGGAVSLAPRLRLSPPPAMRISMRG